MGRLIYILELKIRPGPNRNPITKHVTKDGQEGERERAQASGQVPSKPGLLCEWKRAVYFIFELRSGPGPSPALSHRREGFKLRHFLAQKPKCPTASAGAGGALASSHRSTGEGGGPDFFGDPSAGKPAGVGIGGALRFRPGNSMDFGSTTKDFTRSAEAGEGDTIFARKRLRRVSFADTTAIHFFDRDEDVETPPDPKVGAEGSSQSGLGNEPLGFHGEGTDNEDTRSSPRREEDGVDDDDDEDGGDEDELFVRRYGDSSSPCSTAGSVSSNDGN